MKITKKLLNQTLLIEFYDHMLGGPHAEPMLCQTIGRLVDIQEKHVVLEFWTLKSDDPELQETNAERTAIMRSTIVGVKRLRHSA